VPKRVRGSDRTIGRYDDGVADRIAADLAPKRVDGAAGKFNSAFIRAYDAVALELDNAFFDDHVSIEVST
jgi:hypothetical protein